MRTRTVALGMMTLFLLVGVSLITTSPAALTATASPEAIACGGAGQAPDLVPEVRSAAAKATAMQLNRQLEELLPDALQQDRRSRRHSAAFMFRSVPVDRAELERLSDDLAAFIERAEAIARGPNPECRSAVTRWAPTITEGTLLVTLDRRTDVNLYSYVSDLRFGPLLDAYVLEAVVHAWLQADSLSPTGGFPTDALYERVGELAEGADDADTYALALARAMVPVNVAIMQFGVGNPRDLPAGLRTELSAVDAWKRVACGGEASFEGLNATFDGSFRVTGFDGYQHPFRLPAAFLWVRAKRGDFTLKEWRSLAREGCSPELRSFASWQGVPSVLLDENSPSVRSALIDVIRETENSAEMKVLARTKLAMLLWDSDRSTTALQAQAVSADSIHLRRAASQALAMRWAEGVLDGQIDIDTTLAIQGPDGATVASGTLTQLAYQTTGSDPALARAPVDGLALVYLKNAGVLSF